METDMHSKKLRVAVFGGLGLMASPMARHWKNSQFIEVVRVHDRGTPGEHRERCRQQWREHGAQLLPSIQATIGEGDLDGIIVCCGKNGDDLPLISCISEHVGRSCGDAFICHMSTVSTGFVSAAREYCTSRNVRYENYPLTGGPAGAEQAQLLVLASGCPQLFDLLSKPLAQLGTPRYFGERETAGAEVKFMGHLMVFNGLVGICSAAALHSMSMNAGVIGGEEQGKFFDFLNAGAGGTRQWDLILSNGIKNDIWETPFSLKYAVVDAIYLAQLLIDNGLPWLAIEPIISVALAFSYVINEVDPGLATHSIVKQMVYEKAQALNCFQQKYSAPRGCITEALKKCIDSLPLKIRESVALQVKRADFEQAAVGLRS